MILTKRETLSISENVDIGNKLVDTVGEEEGGMNWESSIETYTLLPCKIESQWEFAVSHREFNSVLCDNLGGVDGMGDGRKLQKEGTNVYPWLIHTDVRQKSAQYYKAITLYQKNKI